MPYQDGFAGRCAGFWRGVGRVFISVCLLGTVMVPVSAALPITDDGAPALEIDGARWQRFLQASRSRYQALSEKSGVLQQLAVDDCVAAPLSLSERRECLRADVFVRAAMEHDGMALDEYAVVLHLTVANLTSSPITAHRRGQFQRLRAEWWQGARTAGQ